MATVRLEVTKERLVPLKMQKSRYQKAIAFTLRLWYDHDNERQDLLLELNGLRTQFGRISLPSVKLGGDGWVQVGRLGDALYRNLRNYFMAESTVYASAVREHLIEPLLPVDLLPQPISGKTRKKKDT
jgi:hypothetical protein